MPKTPGPGLPRTRLLLVTFDLRRPSSGDPRYRRIDRHLAAIGALHRPVKQTRLVVTTQSARSVARAVRARAGANASVLVAEMGRGTAVHVPDPVTRMAVRRLIRLHGIR